MHGCVVRSFRQARQALAHLRGSARQALPEGALPRHQPVHRALSTRGLASEPANTPRALAPQTGGRRVHPTQPACGLHGLLPCGPRLGARRLI